MPPSLILEVLRITELEMDLRDLTRETEQARKVTPRTEYASNVEQLIDEQDELIWRTEDVIDEINELPDGPQDFGKELQRLGAAKSAMSDAVKELEEPSTGPLTVAAETEAIEYLLQARRSKGGGGGGGGSTPGAGQSKGQTDVSALALVGAADDAQGQVDERDVLAATERSGDEPPAELRGALDRYFESLNRSSSSE